jgi:hypothetical protein
MRIRFDFGFELKIEGSGGSYKIEWPRPIVKATGKVEPATGAQEYEPLMKDQYDDMEQRRANAK